MAALTKFELSYAYTFMRSNFALVLFLSELVLNEPMNLQRSLGVTLVVWGTVIAARS
jgi:uncharacterized membrane protein